MVEQAGGVDFGLAEEPGVEGEHIGPDGGEGRAAAGGAVTAVFGEEDGIAPGIVGGGEVEVLADPFAVAVKIDDGGAGRR